MLRRGETATGEVASEMKSDFIIALTQLAAERNLPKEIVLSAIEAALVSAYKKDSEAAGQNISVTLDPGSGDVGVFIVKTVVEEVEDPQTELSVTEARKIKPDAEIDEVVITETLPHSAGRIAAQTAKQVVMQRLREAERELVFEEFADREGEVFTVAVQRIEPKQIIVELSRAEAVLPASEQVPYERYRVGQKVKVLLQSIQRSSKGPEIIVSRTDNLLVRRLFEMEVPEIYNGFVEIMNIAREPGSRSKVAVFAKQDGVDAVGSCVGLRGIRIQNIVNELHGEKIDVVQWSKDPATYISNALSPSMVMRVDIDAEAASGVAVVPDRQLSLAIGKEGQNARLAARLTGWKVDIRSNVEAEAAEKVEAAPPAKAVTPPEAKPVTDEAVEATAEAAAAVAEAAALLAGAPAAVEQEAATAAEEPVVEAPAAELEVAEADVPVQEAPPEEVVEEAPLPEILLPEEGSEPVAVGVGAEDTSASLHDLPETTWTTRGASVPQEGVIRFAEDIDDLRRGGGGRRGPRRGGGNTGARGRNPKAGKRR